MPQNKHVAMTDWFMHARCNGKLLSNNIIVLVHIKWLSQKTVKALLNKQHIKYIVKSEQYRNSVADKHFEDTSVK